MAILTGLIWYVDSITLLGAACEDFGCSTSRFSIGKEVAVVASSTLFASRRILCFLLVVHLCLILRLRLPI